MPRRTLAQLGWDARRLTLILRLDQWERLENEVARTGLSLGDIIAGHITLTLRAQADLDRVSLTPEGENAAEDMAAYNESHKLGTGGAEW
jgi:hypothetical protein